MVNTTAIIAQVTQTLDGLGLTHKVVFAASGAERAAAGFLQYEPNSSRPDDLRLYRDVVDVLWSSESLDAEWLASARRRVSTLPEITAEDEAEGRGFYAECAVVVLLYALDVAAERKGAIENLLKRLHQMADALDLDLEAGETHLEDEVRRQQADLTLIRQAAQISPEERRLLKAQSLEGGLHLSAAFARVPD